MLLTLVVPCYNEEGNVTRFWDETSRVFDGKVSDYEIVFVDDGRVIATGSHDELLVSCPEYARMVELQKLEEEREA